MSFSIIVKDEPAEWLVFVLTNVFAIPLAGKHVIFFIGILTISK